MNQMLILMFFVPVALLVVMNARATFWLLQSPSASRNQKIVQLLLVWLIPMAAFFVLHLHRPQMAMLSNAAATAGYDPVAASYMESGTSFHAASHSYSDDCGSGGDTSGGCDA